MRTIIKERQTKVHKCEAEINAKYLNSFFGQATSMKILKSGPKLSTKPERKSFSSSQIRTRLVRSVLKYYLPEEWPILMARPVPFTKMDGYIYQWV